MKNIDLDSKYQHYLKMVGLKEEDMHSVQRTETKRAFFGGIGIILESFTNEINNMSEEEAVQILDSIDKQVKEYFRNEVNKFNSIMN